jgi:hypothetical protein
MPDRSTKPEDLIVRLTKDGRIVIDGTGLPPRRLRELQEALREVLGPAELYDEERRESPEAPRLWGTTSEEQQQEEEDRERQAE